MEETQESCLPASKPSSHTLGPQASNHTNTRSFAPPGAVGGSVPKLSSHTLLAVLPRDCPEPGHLAPGGQASSR